MKSLQIYHCFDMNFQRRLCYCFYLQDLNRAFDGSISIAKSDEYDQYGLEPSERYLYDCPR